MNECNAKRVSNWIDNYGDEVKGITSVGLTIMNKLKDRKKISLSSLEKAYKFLSKNKTKGYNKINPDYRDTPYKDKNYVAYLGYGGEAMLKYAESKLKQKNEK